MKSIQHRLSHVVVAFVATLTVVASVASVTLTLSLIRAATDMAHEVVLAQSTTDIR